MRQNHNSDACRFLRDDRAAVGIIFALIAVPLLLAIGASVDFIRAYNDRSMLQSAADSAALAVAATYSRSLPEIKIRQTIDAFLAANGSRRSAVAGNPQLSKDGSELCIDVADTVPTTFMRIARIEAVPVSVHACAALPPIKQMEIALVVDVSSSMIEQNRFAPMQTAVLAFLQSFSSNPVLAQRTKISIVPFSSRVSIGLQHTDWLDAYNGSPAIPTRWQDPAQAYPPDYKLSHWLDGATPVISTSKNYYWMGCIEPRADITVRKTGSVGEGNLDTSPYEQPFVPMDSNPKSGKSYCPPPITPLSSDYPYLKRVAANLTSEGSTRLDAGVVAGWYTLSPRWKGVWGDPSSPAPYSQSVRKIMVFMTDGKMNTKYDPASDKFDWLCTASPSKACDDFALKTMQATCTSMKKDGIEIFSLSYSNEADTTNIRACATDTSHFFTASPATVATVYDKIAAAIKGNEVRLTQ